MCFALHTNAILYWADNLGTVHFQSLTIHFLPIVFIHSYTIILVFPPSALFLTALSLLFMNIREAWFQVYFMWAHWKSLPSVSESSLDHSKTWFIFKVPHCTLLAFQYLLAIRHQQDRTHKKEEKRQNIFFPPFRILPQPVWSQLKGGVSSPFLFAQNWLLLGTFLDSDIFLLASPGESTTEF